MRGDIVAQSELLLLIEDCVVENTNLGYRVGVNLSICQYLAKGSERLEKRLENPYKWMKEHNVSIISNLVSVIN